MAEAQQLPEPPASGSAPAWVRWLSKKWGLLVVAGLTALIMMSSNSSVKTAKEARDANNRDFMAAHGAAHGAALAGSRLADQQAEIDARQIALDKKQKELEAQIEAARRNAATPAPPQPAGISQLSPAQQIAQEIAMERLKAGYTSLWSTPIAATRETASPGGAGFANGLTQSLQPRRDSDASTPLERNPTSDSAENDIASHDAIDPNKTRFSYDESIGPYHVIPRYTLIGGTLLNQVNSETGGAVLVQLDPSDKVYVPGTKTLLLPEGTQLLGTAKTISGGGSQRLLGVSFDEIQTPDKYAIAIPSIEGISQNGQTGMTGHVDTHWLSKFGWSILLAGFAGISEIGNTTSGFVYDPAAAFRQQFSNNLGQQGIQQLEQHVMSVPNTVIIPAGTRIKAVLAADLPGVPEWSNHRIAPGTL